MDEDDFLNLCKVAQLHCMPKKSKELFNTLVDFDFEGTLPYECSELKKLLTNAFLLGYNCGIEKKQDKELENSE